MTPEAELHLSAGRSVLDGVGDQVQKELPQTRAISHHHHVRRERQIHRHALCLAEYQSGFVDLLHQRLQLYWLRMQIEPALIGTRQREQALNQITHSPDLLQRFLERHHPLRLRRVLRHRALDISAFQAGGDSPADFLWDSMVPTG